MTMPIHPLGHDVKTTGDGPELNVYVAFNGPNGRGVVVAGPNDEYVDGQAETFVGAPILDDGTESTLSIFEFASISHINGAWYFNGREVAADAFHEVTKHSFVLYNNGDHVTVGMALPPS